MKKIYIINTSSDGNIGAFTNVKKVYEKLNSYFDEFPYSYNQVLKAVREHDILEDINGTGFDIEEFYINGGI